jgi:glycosyltransferase involved in cell wall biosynthesis
MAVTAQASTDIAPTSQLREARISVIIPVFNEEENVEVLFQRLRETLAELDHPYEVIFVDDGSTDASYSKLSALAQADDKFRVIRFVKNFGQTAALSAGIDYATGDVIIPMDADLQNDPIDIKRLLNKLAEGYDVVSGWRKDRQDNLFMRLIPSWAANKLISVISGVNLHDYGCSLKAYRREVIKDVRLYGEMHRFVPIYATWVGARVTEIPVRHYARRFGESKYGISRTFKVILDLLTIKFLSTYATKPIYVFGTAGLASFGTSIVLFGWMIILKYCYQTTFVETPLPVLVAMFFMLGVQFILMGLMAEMITRTYHESQGKRTYKISSMVNLADD